MELGLGLGLGLDVARGDVTWTCGTTSWSNVAGGDNYAWSVLAPKEDLE